ncbi:MAG: hypothetical protein KDD73_02730 [Anaerolineales bacterium]|nr:hypothetical protein [Anaerolineales bacterium]
MSDELQRPLTADDPRLPAVRARLFLLVRALARQGVLRMPLASSAGPPLTLHWLPTLWQRLRVELLGPTLLNEVIPAIERRMNSTGQREARLSHDLPPRATVDWPATWRQQLRQPFQTPLVTRHWQRDLDLPQNRLARAALTAVAHDASQSAVDLPLGEERMLLSRLGERASRRLSAMPWREISAQTPVIDPSDLTRTLRGEAWRRLAQWWQAWQQWQPPHAAAGGVVLDPALEADWLFELLVLFELLMELASRFSLWQSRSLGDAAQRPLFVGRSAAGRFALYYQSGSMFRDQRSLQAVRAIPDIVIELPASRGYVLIDAKNYGPQGHSQAIYKLLGYLYQFGYDAESGHRFEQIQGGILVFPTEEREGRGLHAWQRPVAGAQPVLGLVLPPTGNDQYSGMAELGQWLATRMA